LGWGQWWGVVCPEKFSGELAVVNGNALAEKLNLAFVQDTHTSLNSWGKIQNLTFSKGNI